ncbi:MAG: hypothetical protein M3507_01675 [Actinomycetota bacterium]|nr:hypothetical protein [Actinomycetota bacterium]
MVGNRCSGSWQVPLPDHVDLLVLDGTPLELAGPVAMWGRLLYDDDPPARVTWQGQTHKIYLDEEPRQALVARTFTKARLGGR